jgi:hypothetical protein
MAWIYKETKQLMNYMEEGYKVIITYHFHQSNGDAHKLVALIYGQSNEIVGTVSLGLQNEIAITKESDVFIDILLIKQIIMRVTELICSMKKNKKLKMFDNLPIFFQTQDTEIMIVRDNYDSETFSLIDLIHSSMYTTSKLNKEQIIAIAETNNWKQINKEIK